MSSKIEKVDSNIQSDNKTNQADSQSQIILAGGVAKAVESIVESIQIVVRGHNYRMQLQSIVSSLQKDQVMRHQDVDKIIEMLDKYGHDMLPERRDQCYITILQLLSSVRIPLRLPSPPQS